MPPFLCIELFFCFRLDNRSIRSILTNAFDTVFAAVLLYIAFTCSDNLAVSCFKTESEFASLILVDLKLRVLLFLEALNCLILDISNGSVLSNACSSVFAAFETGINLSAYSDNFSVTGFKTECIACFSLFNNKFSHNSSPKCGANGDNNNTKVLMQSIKNSLLTGPET